MKSVRKNFRFREKDIERLEFIIRIKQEQHDLLMEQHDIAKIVLSHTDIISLLISKEYKKLKEEGYQL